MGSFTHAALRFQSSGLTCFEPQCHLRSVRVRGEVPAGLAWPAPETRRTFPGRNCRGDDCASRRQSWKGVSEHRALAAVSGICRNTCPRRFRQDCLREAAFPMAGHGQPSLSVDCRKPACVGSRCNFRRRPAGAAVRWDCTATPLISSMRHRRFTAASHGKRLARPIAASIHSRLISRLRSNSVADNEAGRGSLNCTNVTAGQTHPTAPQFQLAIP